MTYISIAISFLLQLPYYNPNDELKELLSSYWQKQNFKIEEKKIQIPEHFENYQLMKRDTIPCLGGKSPFEFQEITLKSKEVWNQPKTIIIDNNSQSKKWSMAFIKPFNSNEKEVLVSVSSNFRHLLFDWLSVIEW